MSDHCFSEQSHEIHARSLHYPKDFTFEPGETSIQEDTYRRKPISVLNALLLRRSFDTPTRSRATLSSALISTGSFTAVFLNGLATLICYGLVRTKLV